jgi:hypothetical protein
MTVGSRGLVKRALEKYYATAYYLINATLPRKEHRYDISKRLLVSYQSNLTLMAQQRINPQRMVSVQSANTL